MAGEGDGTRTPPLFLLSEEEDALESLFRASNCCSNLEDSLEILIHESISNARRSHLASKGVLPAVLSIVGSINHHHDVSLLLLCLKLLRNLCAGEIANQNSFLDHAGVVLVSDILRSHHHDGLLVRNGLQVLANVSLAGKHHQRAIWNELYPLGFLSLATNDELDPLPSKLIYTCCHGNPEFFTQLYTHDHGLHLIAQIVTTASSACVNEDCIKLLLSRICLEESQFPLLFSKLLPAENCEFSSEQAFLLQILSEILSDRRNRDVTVSEDVALSVLEIFNKSVRVLDHGVRAQSSLPTGSATVDVLGYTLNILKDICVQYSVGCCNTEDVVDVLLSRGLVEFLLSLLRDLEPPAIIQKFKDKQGATSCSSIPCPYKGFRRDIVALISNCVYRRKHAQDEIRHNNGILLLLQQCVDDADNPLLREWGLYSVRNMLEGNEENQKIVAKLERQGYSDESCA